MTKKCSRCFKEQDEDQFYKNPHSADGRVTYCKTCKAGYDVARYSKNSFNAELLRGWTK